MYVGVPIWPPREGMEPAVLSPSRQSNAGLSVDTMLYNVSETPRALAAINIGLRAAGESLGPTSPIRGIESMRRKEKKKDKVNHTAAHWRCNVASAWVLVHN